MASLDVEDFDYPERDRVEIIRGDIRNKAVVDRAVEGADFVVHTAAALPLYSPDDIYTTDVEGTRNVLDASLRARRQALRPRLLDGGVRDTGPPSAVRDGQAGGRRALRAGQDPGRDDLPGVPGEGPVRPDHPPQVVRRAGAARRLRAALRLGLHGAQLPHDRLGQQPLPAPRRRGPLRRDRPVPHAARRAGQRHLQHRRRASSRR